MQITSLRHFRPLAAAAALSLALGFACCETDSAAATGDTVAAAAGPFDRNKGIKLPAAALDSAKITITDVNYWVENQQFVVAGILSNDALVWQKIYLRVTFQDANGKPVEVNGEPEMFIPATTNSVPPRGRSGFCWTWDMDKFSAPPARCTVSAAGAQQVSPKPIIVALDPSMVNVMTGGAKSVLDTNVQTTLAGHQASFAIFNGTDLVAQKPMVQMMIFGTDNKIWHSNVLVADSTDQVIYAGKSGPLMPREKRVIGFGMLLSALPAELQRVGVGRLEYFPFDGNQ